MLSEGLPARRALVLAAGLLKVPPANRALSARISRRSSLISLIRAVFSYSGCWKENNLGAGFGFTLVGGWDFNMFTQTRLYLHDTQVVRAVELRVLGQLALQRVHRLLQVLSLTGSLVGERGHTDLRKPHPFRLEGSATSISHSPLSPGQRLALP